jgi:tRNA threonylcarbamoyladenosine biosynthesis protein TsaE
LTINHPSILETRTVDWRDESGCARLAAALAQALRGGLQPIDALIELDGPLGAGKTTFARHLLRALGVMGRIKSPTFAVLESYSVAGLEISHFDFYRFGDPREWLDAGFRETLAEPGLKLIEWAAKAGAWLPDADLKVAISPSDSAGDGNDDRRHVALFAATPRGVALLVSLNLLNDLNDFTDLTGLAAGTNAPLDPWIDGAAPAAANPG